jgi:hypothetical protein
VRPKHKYNGDIKIDIKGIGYTGVDWICLTKNDIQLWALVKAVMKLRVL